MRHHARMGVLTTKAQLIAQGLSVSTISRRSRSGRLTRLLPGVYATEKPGYMDLCRAVALWKPDAVFSHSTAGWLWGLVEAEPRSVEATVAPNAQVRSPDWVVLRRRALPDVQKLRGLHVVSIEQAFVDLAATMPTAELEKFFDDAVGTHIPARRLAAFCDTAKGMDGMQALRTQLRRCCPGTFSEAERVVARALTARNLFMDINARVGPYYGDLVDFRARVIVEIDGREFHSTGAVFTSDRRRQNALVLDGWLVLRYSVATVMSDLDAVVEEIVSVVKRRRRSIDADRTSHA